MDTMTAFALGAATRNNEVKVFDWDAAATYIKMNNVTNAMAGLQEDWVCTAGHIFIDGKPDMEDYTFLASTWATPVLTIGETDIECWRYEDQCEWDSHTKWPQSALDILNRKE